MKKTALVFTIPGLIFLYGCKETTTVISCKEQINVLRSQVDSIYNDESLSEETADSLYNILLENAYSQHPEDSVGLWAFTPLITNFWATEKALEEYEKASEFIKSSERVKTKVEAIKNRDNCAPGKQYIEVSGEDAINGNAISLSSFVDGTSPVLIDFWASWCNPCRNEIKNNLIKLSQEGKIRIVGIAVWEKSVEDTRKAIQELGITWPVIYCGGREDSPSIKYGVLGIPTLFLLSKEGTILASGHSIEDFIDLIQAND